MLPFFAGVIPTNIAEALTVSPVRIEVSADPGETHVGAYILRNETDQTRTYFNSFENFEAYGETGNPHFVRSDSGLASWMLGPSAVTLEPGERREIPYTIAVPESAEPGGYFAAIFWGTNPPGDTSDPDGTQVNSKIGILMLLRVNGEILEDGGITEFGLASEDTTYKKPPVEFFYRFRNDGNDRLKPTGEIAFKNLFGKITDRVDANISEGNVLPLSQRRYEVSWNPENLADDYVAPSGFFANAFDQLRNFRFGPHTAIIEVSYGQGNSLTDVREAKFTLMPTQAILFIILVIVLLYLVVWFIRRSYRRAIAKQAEHIAAQIHKNSDHRPRTHAPESAKAATTRRKPQAKRTTKKVPVRKPSPARAKTKRTASKKKS